MVKVHKSLGNSAFSLTNPIKTSIYILVGNLGIQLELYKL